jgi:hypothetical protein
MTPTVLELTDAVCKRPAMVVGRDSYRDAVAFLLGYASGLDAAARGAEMEPLVALLDRFQLWHAQR